MKDYDARLMELLLHMVLFIRKIPHYFSGKNTAVTLHSKHREQSHIVLPKFLWKQNADLKINSHILILFTLLVN